jgi:hypothetical protein
MSTADVTARVLQAVDAATEEMIGLVSSTVRMPSVSGTTGENEAQAGSRSTTGGSTCPR